MLLNRISLEGGITNSKNPVRVANKSKLDYIDLKTFKLRELDKNHPMLLSPGANQGNNQSRN